MPSRQPRGAQESIRSARLSVRLEADSVLRILRGEDLATLADALGVTVASLNRYRSEMLRGGLTVLVGPRAAVGGNDDIERLRARICELTLEIERLWQRIPPREPSKPWAPRMSRA